MSLALAVTALAACAEKEPFSTASDGDYPRIIDPVFPDWTDGAKPVISNIGRDANFSMTLTVTPADYCTVRWYLDGEIVGEGKEIDLSLMAGTYDFRVEISTEAGYLTFREGLVQVNPLDGDPWADEVGFERIATPGAEAVLYGENLDKVSRIVIGDRTVTEIDYDDAGKCISYTIPAEVKDGTLVDASGNEFGGDRLLVTSKPLVTAGADRISKSKEWTMTGVNMDKIESLTIGNQKVTEFSSKKETEIVLTCPELEVGEYILTGTASDGSAVMFYSESGNTTETTVILSSSTVLWEGHHYVSWDLPDDNPNKKFDLIKKDVFATIKAGSVLSIHYSLEPDAEYHQIRTTTTWWNDLPGTAQTDLTADGVFTVTLTQEVLDMIQAQDGFICVGHGYYVDMVTVE